MGSSTKDDRFVSSFFPRESEGCASVVRDLCFDQLPRVLGSTSTFPSLAGNSRRLELVLRVQIWANAQRRLSSSKVGPQVRLALWGVGSGDDMPRTSPPSRRTYATLLTKM